MNAFSRSVFIAAMIGLALLPGAFASNSIFVDGDCRLAHAIMAANTDSRAGGCPAGFGADSIVLNENLTLRQPLPPIRSDITILGYGHRISGNRQQQIFRVERGARLRIEELTLEAGRGKDDGGLSSGDYEVGGAIFNHGRLEIVASLLRDNYAEDAGGAILNNGQLSVSDSQFVGNHARIAGAIDNWIDHARLEIRDSLFRDNSAAQYGGAIDNGGTAIIERSQFNDNSAADGGAISNFVKLTVRDSLFNRNEATRGGAIRNNRSQAELYLASSDFNDNRADRGGAVAVSAGEASIVESLFQGNRAADKGGSLSSGGGATLRIETSSFVDGAAASGGGFSIDGGSLSLRRSLLARNSPDDCQIDYYRASLHESQDNHIGDGSCQPRWRGWVGNDYCPPGQLWDGRCQVGAPRRDGDDGSWPPVDARGDRQDAEPGASTAQRMAYGDAREGRLNDSNFFDDYHFQARAGDVVTIGMEKISGSLDPKLRLYDEYGVELAENDDGGPGQSALISDFRLGKSGRYTIHALRYAVGEAGAYRLWLEEAGGYRAGSKEPKPPGPAAYGAIAVDGSCTLADAIQAANRDRAFGSCPAGRGDDAILLTRDVQLWAELPSIQSSIVIEGQGAAIDARGRHRIFTVAAGGALTVNNAILENGFAADDGELNLVGDGGAILNQGALNLDDCTLQNNNSGEDGGALRNLGQARITNSRFIDNRAHRQGGAIYSDNSSAGEADTSALHVAGSLFQGNRAGKRHAGAIFANGETIINDSQFYDNSAAISAGAIYNLGLLSVASSQFEGNASQKNGGAIFNDYQADVRVSDSFFRGNSARDGGGALMSYGRASASIGGSDFRDNQASRGGGVMVKGFARSGQTFYGDLYLRDNVFQWNRGGDCAIGDYGQLAEDRGNSFSDGGCRAR